MKRFIVFVFLLFFVINGAQGIQVGLPLNRGYEQEEERDPEFPGGEQAMFDFIRRHVKYPESAVKNKVEGKVYVKFTVKADGSLTQFSVVRSVDPDLDAEALRVCEAMPNWIPGFQNGKNVNTHVIVPIIFRLQPQKVKSR